jgi:UDP-3-O-[3-hydroxymyristoyl] N-acetylglucosamine deacetylase
MLLIKSGMLKGGGLENGVVIKGTEVMNPEGVRFPDEMVRHKILDVIGDLSLIGFFFSAHIIAIRSGHAANHAFAHQLVNHMRRT